MIVRELITLLGFRVDRPSADAADRAADRLRQQSERAASAFRNVLASVIMFATAGKLTEVADEMQSLRVRIGMLPQTIDEAGVAFDAVAARANNASQSVSAYANFYIKAGQATQDFITDQADLMRVVDGAAFGLAASGAGAVAQGQAFFQLGQAIGSPTVQMEEMNTLIDVAPELFRALGKSIPGAEGNLKKFISTGKVSGKMLAEGLMKVLPEFEQKMKSMPMMMGQAMTVVGNRFKLGIDKINRSTNFITRMANAVVAAFDAVERGVIKLIEKFGGLDNMLRFLGIAFATAFGIKAIAILNTFSAASLRALLPLLAITVAVLAIAAAIEDLYTWVKGGDSLVGELIGPWEEWSAYVFAAVAMVTDIFMWFGDKIAAAAAVLVGIFTLDWGLMKEGLKGSLGGVWDILKILGEGIWTILSGVFTWIGELLVIIVSAAFDSVVSLVKSIGGFIYDVFVSIGNTLMSLLPNSVISGLRKLVAPVGNILSSIKELFLAVFTFDLDRFLASLTSLSTAVYETFISIGSFVYSIFASAISTIMSLLPNSVLSGLRKLVAPVGNILSSIKELFLATFTFDLNRFLTSLTSLSTAVYETLATWGAFILAPFVDAFTAVVGYFSKVASELTDLLYSAIFDPIVNAVSDAWEAAKSKVSGFGSSISGAWDDVKSTVGFGNVQQGFAPTVTPTQMTAGASTSSFSSATTVNVTVPEGTSSEQSMFLQNAAKQSFSRAADDKLARDISIYGR